MKSSRILYLECARGIASIIVVFHHFSLAFYPSLKNPIFDGGAKFTPFYLAFNGCGAVTFFFLLSGFVLTYGFYLKPSPGLLAASVIKRLPRLMAPASISIFLGLLILLYSGDQYKIASAISKSQWLQGFANANFPQDFCPSFLDALSQCLYVFLSHDNFYYNSNLWTMFIEYYGSLTVFAISFLYLFERVRRRNALIVIHIGLITLFSLTQTSFVPFVVGSGLAYLVAVRRLEFQFSTKPTILLLTIALAGFSNDNWICNTIAALCVMGALLGNRALAARLSGPVGAVVGTMSFPLYLVHTLVILSVTSYVYTQLSNLAWWSVLAIPLSLTVTIAVSFLICIPLVTFDKYCVFVLNKHVKRLVLLLVSNRSTTPSTGAFGHFSLDVTVQGAYPPPQGQSDRQRLGRQPVSPSAANRTLDLDERARPDRLPGRGPRPTRARLHRPLAEAGGSRE